MKTPWLTVRMLLCLCVFSYHTGATPTLADTGNQPGGQLPHHVPSYAGDQGPDIPTVGSSAFDKIFSVTDPKNQSRYDIPFPFQALMSKVGEGQANFVHTLIPFSRSLQRPKDNAYDVLLNPRLVVVAKNSVTALERAKLFIGYVKPRDELEVISYNDEAGRYEFQLVKNYSSNPQVFYVKRGLCLACHQGQAGIFSAAAWADTSIGVMGDLIAARLLGAGLPASPQRAKVITEQLFGLLPSLDAAGNFDALIRESNQLVFHERIWLHGCGLSAECRLGLLLKTLVPNSPITAKYYAVSLAMLMRSPLADQQISPSFISSTNLGVPEVIKKHQQAGSQIPLVNTAYDQNGLLTIIDNIYQLNDKDNPATPRSRDIDRDALLPKTLRAFTPRDYDTILKQVKDVDKMLEILYQEGSELFSPTAVNKPLIMQTLLARIRSPAAHSFEAWLTKKTPPKQLFTGQVFPVFNARALNVFVHHCHSCHGSGASYPTQFLVGGEQQVINQIQQLKHKIHYKLSHDLMPPADNLRARLINSGDREYLLSYLSLPP